MQTLIALVTPPQRGAVATLIVSGPQAVADVAAVFQPASGRSFHDEPPGRIVFGRWGAATGEEVVVCRLNDARVEVHCHGGRIAVAEIAQSLLNLGGRQCDWQEQLELDESDPIAAAARLALASAPTERTAAILLDQYHGGLRRALNELLVPLDRADAAAATALDTLLALGPLGTHLTIPWQVVLAGPPNVGKSSLINALLGYERAIVYDEPGTTRDVLTASAALAGWPVELSDTAGMRATSDVLEAAGIDRASQRVTSADLVLLVMDASTEAETAEDIVALQSNWPRALVVRNKCDLLTAPLSRPEIRAALSGVSALTRAGLDKLAAEIGRRLVPNVPLPGAAVPFTAEQIQDLNECAALVARQRFAEAARLLRARYALR